MEALLPQCMKYIEENPDQETLSLKTISEEFGYSQYHFSRLFRESAGMPVMEYVKRRRSWLKRLHGFYPWPSKAERNGSGKS